MSNAGRPSKITPTNKPRNGDSPQSIPDDLVWDEENPPTIFACSQHTNHQPDCDGTCETKVLDKSGTESINEARAWARAGMSFKGKPDYLSFVPNLPAGINIPLFDMMMQIELLTEILCELQGITREEFNISFREQRTKFMREVREANEASVRGQRAANMLGIVEKKLYGPNGEEL